MPHDEARPLLSLCMIVKNEAEYLETCLKLARPHVDEIVVIDTGSTDGTQDIARRYADVFEEIEWPNSFAAARNYSLDRASGRYILILDGDEYIADPQGWSLIRSILSERHIAALRLKLLNLLPLNSLFKAESVYQERIFPNHPILRYERKVHNQIYQNIVRYKNENGGFIIDVPVEITHFGYAHNYDKIIGKYTRRIPLLEEEYDQAANLTMKYYYAFQLGVVYFMLKDFEKAAFFLESIDFNQMGKDNMMNAFYSQVLLIQSYLELGEYNKALVCCNQLLSYRINEPVLYYLTGISLLLNDKVKEGISFLIESLELNMKKDKIRFLLNDRIVLKNLKIVFEKIGWADVANQISFDDKRYCGAGSKINGILKKIQYCILQTLPESQ